MHELLNKLVTETDFWSAIIGAVVGAVAGGFIAFGIQVINLCAAKRQREQDQRRTQQALANSLLFKMMRIHSNFRGVQTHIEESFEEAQNRGLTGPAWQFIRPLANLPPSVHFSSDEMGMLLAQRDDGVFNAVLSMDAVHNSLLDVLNAYKNERSALMERMTPEQVEGDLGTGVLSREQMLALQPRMAGVNSLVEQLRAQVERDARESVEVLNRLHRLLRERLGLPYRIETAPPVNPE